MFGAIRDRMDSREAARLWLRVLQPIPAWEGRLSARDGWFQAGAAAHGLTRGTRSLPGGHSTIRIPNPPRIPPQAEILAPHPAQKVLGGFPRSHFLSPAPPPPPRLPPSTGQGATQKPPLANVPDASSVVPPRTW